MSHRPAAPMRASAARWLGALIIAALLTCALAVAWLAATPAHAGRPAPVFRAALPGIDLGADAWPSQMGHTAYVEIWAYPHCAGDVAALLRLPLM
jgi:hypothetical protein